MDVASYIEWSNIVAKRFVGKGLPLCDLENEAAIGLLHAHELYDPKKGTRFELYAEWWITRYIRLALVANRPIKIGYTDYHEARAYAKGKPVRRMSEAKAARLNDVINAMSMECVTCNLEELVDSSDDHFEKSYDRTLKALEKLEAVESEVIQLKLGLDGKDELSFEQVTVRMDLNKGSSYYYYKKGVKKLRSMIEAKKVYLKGYHDRIQNDSRSKQEFVPCHRANC